jgi:prepilin-type N-terminal cleavage/methylation domain-containing protein
VRKNQNGLTLIEVLVSLTILSIIGIVMWNVFIDGISYSHKAVSQNTMQQEANLITVSLTKIHQTSDEYEVRSKDCTLSVTHRSEKGTVYKEYKHPRLCFTSNDTGSGNTTFINPSRKDFSLDLKIYDKESPENKLKVNTTLFRLKEE